MTSPYLNATDPEGANWKASLTYLLLTILVIGYVIDRFQAYVGQLWSGTTLSNKAQKKDKAIEIGAHEATLSLVEAITTLEKAAKAHGTKVEITL